MDKAMKDPATGENISFLLDDGAPAEKVMSFRALGEKVNMSEDEFAVVSARLKKLLASPERSIEAISMYGKSLLSMSDDAIKKAMLPDVPEIVLAVGDVSLIGRYGQELYVKLGSKEVFVRAIPELSEVDLAMFAKSADFAAIVHKLRGVPVSTASVESPDLCDVSHTVADSASFWSASKPKLGLLNKVVVSYDFSKSSFDTRVYGADGKLSLKFCTFGVPGDGTVFLKEVVSSLCSKSLSVLDRLPESKSGSLIFTKGGYRFEEKLGVSKGILEALEEVYESIDATPETDFEETSQTADNIAGEVAKEFKVNFDELMKLVVKDKRWSRLYMGEMYKGSRTKDYKKWMKQAVSEYHKVVTVEEKVAKKFSEVDMMDQIAEGYEGVGLLEGFVDDAKEKGISEKSIIKYLVDKDYEEAAAVAEVERASKSGSLDKSVSTRITECLSERFPLPNIVSCLATEFDMSSDDALSAISKVADEVSSVVKEALVHRLTVGERYCDRKSGDCGVAIAPRGGLWGQIEMDKGYVYGCGKDVAGEDIVSEKLFKKADLEDVSLDKNADESLKLGEDVLFIGSGASAPSHGQRGRLQEISDDKSKVKVSFDSPSMKGFSNRWISAKYVKMASMSLDVAFTHAVDVVKGAVAKLVDKLATYQGDVLKSIIANIHDKKIGESEQEFLATFAFVDSFKKSGIRSPLFLNRVKLVLAGDEIDVSDADIKPLVDKESPESPSAPEPDSEIAPVAPPAPEVTAVYTADTIDSVWVGYENGVVHNIFSKEAYPEYYSGVVPIEQIKAQIISFMSSKSLPKPALVPTVVLEVKGGKLVSKEFCPCRRTRLGISKLKEVYARLDDNFIASLKEGVTETDLFVAIAKQIEDRLRIEIFSKGGEEV